MPDHDDGVDAAADDSHGVDDTYDGGPAHDPHDCARCGCPGADYDRIEPRYAGLHYVSGYARAGRAPDLGAEGPHAAEEHASGDRA